MSGSRVLILGDVPALVAVVVRAAGLEPVRSRPDLVLCHGGDGTLLRAERMYPGVPKIPVRAGTRSEPCTQHRLERVLERLLADELDVEVLPKIEARVGAWRGLAVNDVVLRNHNPAIAVRFELTIGEQSTAELTGDGLVIATPFGSTGYYRSVTRSSVATGLGVAFNNCTEVRAPLHHTDERPIIVRIVRGPAVLVHDNDARPIPVRAGQGFVVAAAAETATILGLDALRCQECRREGGQRYNPH